MSKSNNVTTKTTDHTANSEVLNKPNNVASTMADYIAEAGVSHVFTYPGGPTIELMEALRTRVEVVLGRREGTAAFMAEGYAQATGRLGACVSTLGPGSTALVNGVAAANWDRAPMLAISGQIDVRREQYFTHQVVDHGALFRPITKWSGAVQSGAVGTIMRKAIRTAMAERPGAVHLSVSGEELSVPNDEGPVKLPPMEALAGGVNVSYRDGMPVEPNIALSKARRPVVIAGPGVTRANGREALELFASTIGIPVVVAPMAKGAISESHSYFAGVLDMACNQIVWDFLDTADLILAVGFDPVELINPWKLDTPVIHIDAIPNTDQVYSADLEIVGNISHILDWLRGDWSGQERWSEEEVHKHRERLRTTYYSGRVAGRLNPTDVVDIVQASVPDSAVASCDVGSHKLLVGQGWHTREERGVLMSNGLSSMGFGLPAAIGAKLALQDRPVVALIGDGGFAMTATELRLAAQLNLPLLVVVFVDESLNRIELKQQALGYPSTATRIEPTNLVQLAESMGCHAVRASTPAELESVLSQNSVTSGPLLVEAIIDPTQYQAQF